MFSSTAFAQAAGAQAPGPSLMEIFFPFLAILFVFYFFISRPQQKKLKEQQALLAGLKRGDNVVTSGGILGEVTGLTDKVVTLQIADSVRIKVLRSQILTLAKEGTAT